MYVKYVRVRNYRSFKDVEMYFHPQANYLVGENSIGKSSFLRLLSLLSSGFGLQETDYADPGQPVVIEVKLVLLDNEQEYFVDAPGKHVGELRLRLEKKIEEIVPRLYNDEDGSLLPLNLIRRFRYVFHSSFMPEQQLFTAHIHKLLERKLHELCGQEPESLLPENTWKYAWKFAQQQEQYAAVVAHAVNPAVYGNGLTGVLQAKIAAHMRALHACNRCVIHVYQSLLLRFRLSRNYSFADKQERTVGRSKVVRKFLYRNFLPPEVQKG